MSSVPSLLNLYILNAPGLSNEFSLSTCDIVTTLHTHVWLALYLNKVSGPVTFTGLHMLITIIYISDFTFNVIVCVSIFINADVRFKDFVRVVNRIGILKTTQFSANIIGHCGAR